MTINGGRTLCGLIMSAVATSGMEPAAVAEKAGVTEDYLLAIMDGQHLPSIDLADRIISAAGAQMAVTYYRPRGTDKP